MSGLRSRWFLSKEELIKLPGAPSMKRLGENRRVAVIECAERIPCNPCEAACPHGAIKIGEDITNLPILIEGKCTGCGLCIAACPGLAIYLVNGAFSDSEALISIPYEFLPLPRVGDQVEALDREGKKVCMGKIVEVIESKKFDRTPLVSLTVPKNYALDVTCIRVLG